jgi:hypothetical protein
MHGITPGKGVTVVFVVVRLRSLNYEVCVRQRTAGRRGCPLQVRLSGGEKEHCSCNTWSAILVHGLSQLLLTVNSVPVDLARDGTEAYNTFPLPNPIQVVFTIFHSMDLNVGDNLD